MNDRELVMLIQATNDAAAFGELVRRHQAPLRAFLGRMTGDFATAEDLAQDAFMRAFKGLKSFKAASSFRTWLFAIAYREFLKDRRRAGALARFVNLLSGGGAAADSVPPADAPQRIDLERGLAGLDRQERAALLLCDGCGFTHEEASAAMDAPLGSVKTYVRRGRARLRDALDPAANGAEERSKQESAGADA